ncbi:MAG: Xaa-Pro peptidase family protein [Ignavibacteriales bacterium]|nr:Xaa-Pro peptidase family protein [Ignavibacteriales bacterium]
MKKIIALLALLCPLLCAQERFSQQEYQSRIVHLAHLLDTASVLAMKSSETHQRTNDVGYPYRQESNFLYITGVTHQGCYFLLAPKGIQLGDRHVRSILFVPKGTTSLNAGCDTVLDVGAFQPLFKQSAAGAQMVYYSAPDIRFVSDWVNDRAMFLDRETRKAFEERNPGTKLKTATSLFSRLREIKSGEEIRMMRKAIAMTGDGIRRSAQRCAPGLRESVLQAEVEYEMTRQGASGLAFSSIIGSGPNSLIPHYDANLRIMEAGEVVVMDVGAEYAGYAADVTRTLPVGGTFSADQKKIYNAVRRAQDEVFAIIKPGTTLGDLDRKASEVIKREGFGKFILHGVTHAVGLDVHDVSSSDVLRAGMVVTVEPGIYVPVNADDVPAGQRGVGIRIEDDVLVTETGCEILTNEIPRESAEIESMMRSKR